MTRDIVDYYANLYSENNRLHEGLGRFEYERTKDILGRYLHLDRSVILDIGGGPVAYALWLAAQQFPPVPKVLYDLCRRALLGPLSEPRNRVRHVLHSDK